VKTLSLQVAAAVVTLALGIPLTFFPIKWARAIGWKIPDDLSLARYFGRCLGVVVLALCGLATYASLHPDLATLICAAIALTMLAISLVHIVGWLEKAQPLFETIEIFLYAGGGGYFLWLALQ
jgi:hypothetical protein